MNIDEARKTLGVHESSTEEDIKKAFRKLAAENHPDKNPGDKTAEDKFKQINQAHRILTGQEQPDGAQVGGFRRQGNYGPFGQPFGGSPFGGFDDLFNDFFRGGNTQKQRSIAIADILHVIQLSFEETVLGCKKEINYKKHIYCDKCNGQGKYGKTDKCNVCDGSGVIGSNFSSGYTTTIYTTTCNSCGGTGKQLQICDKCNGSQFSFEDVSLKLVVPPISSTTEMRAKGKGNQLGQLHSDLIIHAVPAMEGQKGSKYENFYIDGKNVYSTVEVGFDKLMFGGELEVNIVGSDEKQKLQIDKYTKLDSELVIQGFGLRTPARPGNHIVQLKLKYPPRENINSTEDMEQIKIALHKLYNERSNG